MTKESFNTDNDFGFTFANEDEIKGDLEVKVVQAEKTAESISIQAQQSLYDLRNMITPLLNNLAKEPEKTHIKWPERAVKIKAFSKKLDTFVEEAVSKLK